MKRWQIVAALALGFIIGGFADLWFINNVGYDAIENGGQSAWVWGGKPVGENIAFGLVFYLLGFFLYAYSACLIISTMIVNGWWRRRAFPFRRPQLRVLWPLLTMSILGALGAVSLNQSAITDDYRHAAAEEAFAASTIAIALPDMQAFTADCQRALLALLLLILLSWGGAHWHHQRHRPLPVLAAVRDNSQ